MPRLESYGHFMGQVEEESERPVHTHVFGSDSPRGFAETAQWPDNL